MKAWRGAPARGRGSSPEPIRSVLLRGLASGPRLTLLSIAILKTHHSFKYSINMYADTQFLIKCPDAVSVSQWCLSPPSNVRLLFLRFASLLPRTSAHLLEPREHVVVFETSLRRRTRLSRDRLTLGGSRHLSEQWHLRTRGAHLAGVQLIVFE